jgi:hypothetical protein
MNKDELAKMKKRFDRLELVASTNARFQHGRDRRWARSHWAFTGIALLFGGAAGITGIGNVVGATTVGVLAAIGTIAAAFDAQRRYAEISGVARKGSAAFDGIYTRAAAFRDLKLATATYQQAVEKDEDLEAELTQLIKDSRDAIPAAAVDGANEGGQR